MAVGQLAGGRPQWSNVEHC